MNVTAKEKRIRMTWREDDVAFFRRRGKGPQDHGLQRCSPTSTRAPPRGNAMTAKPKRGDEDARPEKEPELKPPP